MYDQKCLDDQLVRGSFRVPKCRFYVSLYINNYVVILIQRPTLLGLGLLLEGKVDVINLHITYNLQRQIVIDSVGLLSVLSLSRKPNRKPLHRTYVPVKSHCIRSEDHTHHDS